MGLICMWRGHDLDEEEIISIHRETNLGKYKMAKKPAHFCKRCQCLIFKPWELYSPSTGKVKA